MAFTWMTRLAEALPLFLLAIMVVILASPQRLGEPTTKRVLTNIEFVVDVSGSMTSPFGEGDRYDAAMASINDFIDFREGDAFGLTIFGDMVLHWVPLTSDPSAIRHATPFLSPRSLPRWFGQGTQIGMALDEGLKVLSAREKGDRMIILLSDGYSYDLSSGRDEAIAQRLKDANIVCYCIHAADSEAPPQLGLIASRTGGQVFTAGDPNALAAVFQRIDEMAKTKVEQVGAEPLDHFQPWCLAGLAVGGLHLMCLFGLRYTPW